MLEEVRPGLSLWSGRNIATARLPDVLGQKQRRGFSSGGALDAFTKGHLELDAAKPFAGFPLHAYIFWLTIFFFFYV